MRLVEVGDWIARKAAEEAQLRAPQAHRLRPARLCTTQRAAENQRAAGGMAGPSVRSAVRRMARPSVRSAVFGKAVGPIGGVIPPHPRCAARSRPASRASPIRAQSRGRARRNGRPARRSSCGPARARASGSAARPCRRVLRWLALTDVPCAAAAASPARARGGPRVLSCRRTPRGEIYPRGGCLTRGIRACTQV